MPSRGALLVASRCNSRCQPIFLLKVRCLRWWVNVVTRAFADPKGLSMNKYLKHAFPEVPNIRKIGKKEFKREMFVPVVWSLVGGRCGHSLFLSYSRAKEGMWGRLGRGQFLCGSVRWRAGGRCTKTCVCVWGLTCTAHVSGAKKDPQSQKKSHEQHQRIFLNNSRGLSVRRDYHQGFAQPDLRAEKKGALSGGFVLIFLCLRPKRAPKKICAKPWLPVIRA